MANVTLLSQSDWSVVELREQITGAALFFRGYNVTNLGRSRELLLHPAFGPIVERKLREAAEICSEQIGRPCNLLQRVRDHVETTLDTYADAVAMIVAMELVHLELLREFFGVDYRQAQLACGYSLGEVTALVAGEMIDLQSALRVPLAMAADVAALADDVTLGVLFSRGPILDLSVVDNLCRQVNQAGNGVMGVSTILSPNSVLLLGQRDTIERFTALMRQAFPERVYLRKNDQRWPPMHTPLVWQRNVPNRSAVMLHTLNVLREQPTMPIFSLVTGKSNYYESTIRQILALWVDHPQRLWEAVYEILARDCRLVLHVGPEPNLVPATFKRLADNVLAQLADRSFTGFGLRAVSQVMRRPWLAKMLPSRTALLRAPLVEQIVVEDWLLAQRLP